MSEVIVVGEYMNYWFLSFFNWILGVIVVFFLMVVNLVLVKVFGEFEFWFVLIKVVIIVLMIIVGLGLILFGIGNGGNLIGIFNLWLYGGFMLNGFIGFFFVLFIVIGLY